MPFMSRLRSPLVAAILGGCAACGGARPAAPSAPATVKPPAEVSARPSAAAAAPTAVPAPIVRGAVELLHLAPVQIGVSSTADPKSPDLLVDGRADTAWVAKPGDLTSAWIGFRVPEDARVETIDLVVGTPRPSALGSDPKGARPVPAPADDPFALHPRIRRLTVIRAPADATTCSPELLRRAQPSDTFTLDPGQPGLQSIPVRGAGGAFCLFVRETTAGTKARELAVAELRVTGTLGAALRGPYEVVSVAVGSLPAPWVPLELLPFEEGAETELAGVGVDEELVKRPHASVLALCAAYLAAHQREVQQFASGPYPAIPGSIACREVPSPVRLPAVAPYRSLHVLETRDGRMRTLRLTLETGDGFWFTPLVFEGGFYAEPHDPSSNWAWAGLEAIRVENGYAVMVHDWLFQDQVLKSERAVREPVIVRGASFCTVVKAKLACFQWHPDSAPPLAVKRGGGVRSAAMLAAFPWEGEVPFVVDALGKVRRAAR